MMTTARMWLAVFLLALPVSHQCAAATGGDEWEVRQQTLDAACQSAREARLSVDRAKYIEECVAKQLKESRAACERFYADYGDRTGSRPPLYYDLPECRRAFEHQRSQRNPDYPKHPD